VRVADDGERIRVARDWIGGRPQLDEVVLPTGGHKRHLDATEAHAIADSKISPGVQLLAHPNRLPCETGGVHIGVRD
jgi:hypothetical protein